MLDTAAVLHCRDVAIAPGLVSENYWHYLRGTAFTSAGTCLTFKRAPHDSRIIRLVGSSICCAEPACPSMRLINRFAARTPMSRHDWATVVNGGCNWLVR